MIKTSRSIRERWRSTAILIAVAAMLAILIAPALASAVTPQVRTAGAGKHNTNDFSGAGRVRHHLDRCVGRTLSHLSNKVRRNSLGMGG